MNRQTLADVLQSTNQTGSYTLATVLEGAEAELDQTQFDKVTPVEQ